MSDRRVAIRIGMEGGPEITRGLQDISRAGTDGFDRMAKSWSMAGEQADKYKQQLAGIAAAAKQAAQSDEVNRSWSNFLGVNDQVTKSARDSAAAFEQGQQSLGKLNAMMEFHLGSLGRAFTAYRLFNYGIESVRATASLTEEQLKNLGINDFDEKALARARNLDQGMERFFTRLKMWVADAVVDWTTLGGAIPYVQNLMAGKTAAWAAWTPSLHPGPIDFNRRLDMAAQAREDALSVNSQNDVFLRNLGEVNITPGFDAEARAHQEFLAAQSAAPIAEDVTRRQGFQNFLNAAPGALASSTGKSVTEELKAYNDIEKATQERLKASQKQSEYEEAIFAALEDEVTAAGQGTQEREKTLEVSRLQWRLGRDLTDNEKERVEILIAARHEAERFGQLQDAMIQTFGGWLKQVETTGKFSFGNLFRGILSDWEDMLNKMIADQTFQQIFGGSASGGGGIFGAIAGAFFGGLAGGGAAGDVGAVAGGYHSGGMAGEVTASRAFPASWLATAPRYHLGVDEVPAILQRGERVLNRSQTRAYNSNPWSGGNGGAQQVQVNVVIDPNPIFDARVQSVSQGEIVKAAPSLVSASVTAVNKRSRNSGGRI